MSGQHRQPRRLRAAGEGRAARMDAVDRRKLFEVSHPEVPIVPPGSRWRAVVPLGTIPGSPDEIMIGDYELGGLMDQLEQIYPPQDKPGGGSG